MAGTIQVPSWPARGVPAQASMTARAALSKRSSFPGVRRKARSVLRNERGSENSATGSTMRGSGLHHSTGCPALNQGNRPLR